MKHGENKRKHLDFIQLTITRMGANSFLLKAWTVTLVAALFAIGNKDAVTNIYYLSFLPILVFWILDSYYLHIEKMFRLLYDSVRAIDEQDIDFSLRTEAYTDSIKASWLRCMFTVTEVGFYLPLTILTTLAIYIVR